MTIKELIMYNKKSLIVVIKNITSPLFITIFEEYKFQLDIVKFGNIHLNHTLL